jgi:hypothetical protein
MAEAAESSRLLWGTELPEWASHPAVLGKIASIWRASNTEAPRMKGMNKRQRRAPLVLCAR